MSDEATKRQLAEELAAYRELAAMIEDLMPDARVEYRVEVFKALMARMSIKQALGGLVDLPFQFADRLDRRGRLHGD